NDELGAEADVGVCAEVPLPRPAGHAQSGLHPVLLPEQGVVPHHARDDPDRLPCREDGRGRPGGGQGQGPRLRGRVAAHRRRSGRGRHRGRHHRDPLPAAGELRDRVLADGEGERPARGRPAPCIARDGGLVHRELRRGHENVAGAEGLPAAVRAHRTSLRLAAPVCLLALTGCAYQGIAPTSRKVHELYTTIFVLAGCVFAVVVVWLLVSLVLFRRRKGDTGQPPQREGRALIVVGFFLIGAAIVSLLFPFGERTLA